MPSVPRNETGGPWDPGFDGGQDEGVAEAQLFRHQGQKALHREPGEHDRKCRGREHGDVVALGQVVIKLPDLLGRQVEGEDSADLKEVDQGRGRRGEPREPSKKRPIEAVVPVSVVAEVDDEKVAVEDDYARLRDHRRASPQVGKWDAVALSWASMAAQASGNGRRATGSLRVASLAGPRTAQGLPRRVMRTLPPRATYRSASPVRFLSSLAVMTFMPHLSRSPFLAQSSYFPRPVKHGAVS